MACQIKRKEDGTISEVLAPNGKPSILYRDLVTTITNNEASVNAIRSDSYVSDIMSTEYIANNTVSELALAAWSKAYTSSFMDSFGYWNEEKLDNTDINGEPLLQELFPILKSTKETDVKQTIEAIASRMASRIGIRYTIIDDPNQDFKGRVDNFGAFINLAYATKDTPIHEIVAHPIIRAIKSKKITKASEIPVNEFSFPQDTITFKVYKKKNWLGLSTWYYTTTKPTMDENGKLVDTVIKKDVPTVDSSALRYYQIAVAFEPNLPSQSKLYLNLLKELEYGTGKEVLDRIKRDYPFKVKFNKKTDKYEKVEITLAEQQEEAIVELLGMMTAQKLDEVKDKGLIAVLRQLLKEIKTFVLNLMRQKEIDIDNLPDNLTLNDISNIIAYSDNKLVLPGYKVEYTTPDNMKFETYQDASKHITKLVKDLKNVEPESKSLVDKIVDPITGKDIVSIYVNIGSPEQFVTDDDGGQYVIPEKESSVTLNFDDGTTKSYNESELPDAMFTMYMDNFYNKLRSKIEYEEFLDKNLEYEKSKLIVEDWKKANKITYNPNEVYSRGYEFVSVLGAYAKLDADLLLKNLIQHIEDNQKAGGEFVISAFTKKVDRKKSVLEGQGGKIKFKIYPQPNDIKWAADSDVYSGSVWDASKFVSKKQSELMGVSYTKYPKLDNLRRVKPNLAATLSDSEDIYNELGIVLTGKNFRLAYDRDINADTKKLIDNINKLLDMKYGKLIPPSIIETTNFVNIPVLYENKEYKTIRSYSYENDMYRYYDITDGKETIKGLTSDKFVFKERPRKGIEPKIKPRDIKKSILEIKNDYNAKSIYDLQRLSQINLNLKVAKLKEVGTKYPRALITSKLVLDEYEQQFTLYGLFQKIPSTVKPGVAELFEDTPELANAVYEALGFKSIPAIINEAFKKEKEVNEAFSDSESTFVYYGDEDMEDLEGNRINPIDTVELSKEYRRKGLGTLKYILEGEKNLKKGMYMTSDPTKRVSQVADKIWNKLISLGLAEKRNERYYYLGSKITPQQEQQAQQLYSQYLDSLNKPNTNPILQGNQQEQVKKFAELQERLNNKEFLEGSKFAYESTPALQELGTQEEYNDYIARVSLGILKNPSSGEYNYTSKVKDIVYHGTVGTWFKKEKFALDKGSKKTTNKSNQYGYWFGENKQVATIFNSVDLKSLASDLKTNVKLFEEKLDIIQETYKISDDEIDIIVQETIEYMEASFTDYSKQFYKPSTSNTVSVIINAVNLDNVDTLKFAGSTRGDGQNALDYLSTFKGDSLILEQVEDAGPGGEEFEFGKNYAVKNSNQIHILGSNTDIQQFKQYVQTSSGKNWTNVENNCPKL